MRKILFLLFVGLAIGASAADCDITISAISINQGENVPERIKDQIKSRLIVATTGSGVTVIDGYDRFFIAAKFNNSYHEVIPGPPMMTAIKSTMTVYIGDSNDKKIFASTSFDVNGVGNSEERAYAKALSTLNKKNSQLSSFISGGVEKILEYYDNNYPQILAKAQESLKMKDYQEALYYSTSIPSCCKGYEKALSLSKEIYQEYINNEGKLLLAQAKAIWGANPGLEAGEESLNTIAQIDPYASCYREAVKFGETITATIFMAKKKHYEFETFKKYEDQLALQKDAIETERMRINAAKEVAKAWAENYKPAENHYHWVK